MGAFSCLHSNAVPEDDVSDDLKYLIVRDCKVILAHQNVSGCTASLIRVSEERHGFVVGVAVVAEEQVRSSPENGPVVRVVDQGEGLSLQIESCRTRGGVPQGTEK